MSLVEQGYQQHHNRDKLHLCTAAAWKRGGRLLSVVPFIGLSWPIRPQRNPEEQDASSFSYACFLDNNCAQTWKTTWLIAEGHTRQLNSVSSPI